RPRVPPLPHREPEVLMRHRLTPLLLVATFACAGDTTTAPESRDAAFDRVPGADTGGRGLMVELSGDQEVPPNLSPATGTLHMTLNPGLDRLCYELTAQDLLGGLTGSHIHRAPAGVNGPVVVPLLVPAGGSSSDCVDIDSALLWEIWRAPENFYVNV